MNDRSDISTIALKSVGAPVIRAQILLDRARFSPGEIDGKFGPDLEIAVRGYQESHQLNPTGVIDAELWALLNRDPSNLLIEYTIAEPDLRETIVQIPKAVRKQSKLKRLGYESAEERMAERFHLSPKLLTEMNPGVGFDKPGQKILIPQINRAVGSEAAKIVVSKSKRTVAAFSEDGKLLAQYPAAIGGPHDPLPIGSWAVSVVQPYPVFYYNPERFWNVDKSKPKAKLPPGPNNPAGVVWIGLSKAHYGIHGSPEPGTIRRTQSYGCIRLTNWDAADLSQMIKVGTPAILEE